MNNGVSYALGRKFANQGNASRAAEIFKKGGMKEERREVEKLASILRLAKKLEKYGFHVFCTDLLAKNGLFKELGEFAERIKGAGGASEHYARFVACTRQNDMGEIEQIHDALNTHGPWGAYLFGKALVRYNAEAAGMVADSLSGKNGEWDGGDGVVSSCMENVSSYLAWENSSRAESRLFGMKLYMQLGKMKEARECLEDLCKAGGEEYVYGLSLMEKRGVEGMPINMRNAEGANLAVRLARHTSSMVQETRGDGEEAKYSFFKNGLFGVQKYLEDSIREEGLGLAIGVIEGSVGRIARREMCKIEGAMLSVASGGLEGITGAISRLSCVRFRFIKEAEIEVERSPYLRAADAAFALKGDMDAQKVAGEIYAKEQDEKVFGCILRLLERGKEKEAGRIAAKGIMYGKNAGEEWLSRFRDLAGAMEKKHRAFGLNVYIYMKEREGVMRVAREMLAGRGTLEELKDAATQVSLFNKRSQLMRNLMNALEAHSAEGACVARSIRAKMGVPAVFRVEM